VTQGKAANAGANHGHLTHDDRVEAATILPRGERWKRRLPRVLW
jgi:L-fucose isomerase-like protein